MFSQLAVCSLSEAVGGRINTGNKERPDISMWERQKTPERPGGWGSRSNGGQRGRARKREMSKTWDWLRRRAWGREKETLEGGLRRNSCVMPNRTAFLFLQEHFSKEMTFRACRVRSACTREHAS